MKNTFLSILLLALVGPCLLLAKNRSEKNIGQEEPNIISLAEFVKIIETGMPLENLRNMILECPQGAELPLKMTIRGDMLSLEPNLVTLKLLKPCYIKAHKGPLLFSSDLKVWKEFSEYFTGKTAASLDFQNQAVLVNLELELNQYRHRWEAPFVQWKEPRCKEVYIHTWSSPCYPESYPQPPVYTNPAEVEQPPIMEKKAEARSRWW